MAQHRDIYQEITDKIVAELEKGAAPWVREWKGSAGVIGRGSQINHVSQKAYRGINHVVLTMAAAAGGFKSNVWLTFKQAQAAKAHVIKGSKGTEIIFYKPQKIRERQPDGTYKEKKIPLLRTYYVFNADQVEGLKLPVVEPVAEPVAPTRVNCEFIDAVHMLEGLDLRHGGPDAFYSPLGDFVQMPERRTFRTDANYKATLAHELVHWTSRDTRANRKLGGKFGDAEYAFEELVAELGAAFTCARFGIEGELRHAGYIDSWLKVLKGDKKAIFRASTLATKAVEWLYAEEAEVSEVSEAA